MKRVLILGCLLIALASSLEAQWINTGDNSAFNFVAPDEVTANTRNEVLFPFGEARTYTANNDTLTLTVNQFYTFYSTASDSIIADTRFFLTIDAQVTRGAMLFLEVPSGHLAQDFIPATGFLGVTVAGVSHKTKWLSFIYNGTAFLPISSIQID